MRAFTAAATASAFAPGPSVHREARRPAVPFHFRSKPCAAARDLDARDVLEPHRWCRRASVRRRIVLELLGRAEAAFGRHRRGEHLRLGRRLAADLAGGELHVLPAHRRQHLRRRQAVAVQLVRVEPDVHRVLGAEQLRAADARACARSGRARARREVVERVAADRRIARTAARPPSGSRRSPSTPSRPAAPLRSAGAASPAPPCSAPASARCRDRCRA